MNGAAMVFHVNTQAARTIDMKNHCSTADTSDAEEETSCWAVHDLFGAVVNPRLCADAGVVSTQLGLLPGQFSSAPMYMLPLPVMTGHVQN